jgi:hypothetical protein
MNYFDAAGDDHDHDYEICCLMCEFLIDRLDCV